MNSRKAFGGLLDGSGWSTLLSKAKLATEGIADSYLVSSDLDRTRYVHQVTTVVLAILQRDAWVEAISVGHNNETSFETWKKMVDNSPTFQYWDIILGRVINSYLSACSSYWKFR